MDSSTLKTVEKAQEKLRALEEEIRKIKRFINSAYDLEGEAPIYLDVDETSRPATAISRKDQFYGRPLATVAREILEMRFAANLGAASIDEIFDALKSGGYQFEFKDQETAKRGVGISLAKNTTVFHRLPNGYYGLAAWYPNAKKAKAESKTTSAEESEKEGADVDS
jgi:hypothetical protein